MTKPMGLALLLLVLLPTWGCGSSDSGSEFKDTCESYCNVLGICEGTSRVADKQCVERCLEVFDKVVEDGDPESCTTANLDTFICATDLVCTDLKEFVLIIVTEKKLAKLELGTLTCKNSASASGCCQSKLVAVVENCPRSFVVK